MFDKGKNETPGLSRYSFSGKLLYDPKVSRGFIGILRIFARGKELHFISCQQ